MSRIGKKPIEIPAGVEVRVEGDLVQVKGPRGQLVQKLHPFVAAAVKDKQILISVSNPEDGRQNALWGLFRSLVSNMVAGVVSGFEKKLEINGIGYKASASGRKLTLNVGFSHPIEFELPEGITCQVEKNLITVAGNDKQLVGEVAANIRKIRKPEPYKGKGIKYADEVLRHKVGKAAAKASA